MNIAAEFRTLAVDGALDLPFPGCGNTRLRFRRLIEIARTDLALARLAEAHVDALAILREAGKEPHSGCLYGVWAAETPGHSVRLKDGKLSGMKMFCTGASLADRALMTVVAPEPRLVDADLRTSRHTMSFDESGWKTSAFAEVHTATVSFDNTCLHGSDLIGPPGWYLARPGFWHGACAPAACWAGGALGLVDYAVEKTRSNNPHAVAHLGAMGAAAWNLRTVLDAAGDEIDGSNDDTETSMKRALIVRHLVEQTCTEILCRFGRTFGPRPLAFEREMADRCQQLTLYIRQSHAECDLEALGRRLLDPYHNVRSRTDSQHLDL